MYMLRHDDEGKHGDVVPLAGTSDCFEDDQCNAFVHEHGLASIGREGQLVGMVWQVVPTWHSHIVADPA